MENQAVMDNNFSLDIDTLKKCFEIIQMKNQVNQANILEAQKYIAECRKDQQFPVVLLTVFDDASQDVNIRLLAIVEFKNLIKDSWAIRKGSRTSSTYPDQFKKDIRAVLLTYLDKYQEKHFRSQIIDLLKIICFTDFPVHYPELVQYFLNNMEGLKETLKNDEMLLSDVTMNFVRTLKIIVTDRSRKRIGDTKNIFESVYFKLIGNFHEFWDYFHTNMPNLIKAVNQGNLMQILRFIKLSKKADSIYIAFLCNGCQEMVTNQDIIKITSLLVQRAAELTEIVKNLKGTKGLETLHEEISKNLHKLLYSLSLLQAIFPLLFREVLTNYIQLLEYIIDNAESFPGEYVLKSAVICLNSALRRYSYHADDKKVLAPVYEELKKQCVMEFYNYFTEEKIQNFFNIFLLKLLPKRPFLTGDQDSDNLDEFVEIENDQYTSEFEKLETPLYNLTLKCTFEFLQRFAQQSIPIVHDLAGKVINKQLGDLPPLLQDGIFAMVGQLPSAYQAMNIAPANYLDLGSVLKYLEENAGQDLNLSKRIPVLIHKWIGIFDDNTKMQIAQNIVQITQALPNYVVRYECCMCLKVILKSNLNFNYAALSEHLVPIVIDLLGRFRKPNPHAIWGLIEILKLLFTRAQYSTQNDNIIAQLQSENIQILTQLDDDFLLPSLVDLFKTVIASFPFNTVLTSIFTICINFIDFHFKNNKFKSALSGLWLFLAREYTAAQGVGDAMKALFVRYSGTLLAINDPDELSKFINLIEEYILAELIVPDDYINIIKIMEQKYELTIKVNVPTEGIFNLKSALLSLMSTLLLIVIRQNAVESLTIFDRMVMFLLRDLVNDFYDAEFKSLKAFKVSMTTLINRFVILNLNGFIEILNKFQIDLNTFLTYWVKNMSFLLSTQTKRINVVAISQLLPCITDKETLGNYLEDFLKNSIPELVVSAENGANAHELKVLGTKERCEDVRDSERKREIRQTALYYDVDIKTLFTKAIKDTLQANNFSLDDLRLCIKDSNTVEILVQLINS